MQHVFGLLLALRIVNALTNRTFFQPDEYYQALEPAWQMAFGQGSGAWITWEWREQLRSSLHPALFAALYRAISGICSLSPDVLIAAPKITQAVFAAAIDHSTWRLAERAYGRGSSAAWASLALSVCSPWQWFCSTRTLSNCVETMLTACALVWWPWPGVTPCGSLGRRWSLVAAALAVVLRPTNVLIWMCVGVSSVWRAGACERRALVQWTVLCGCGVLAGSAFADRLYYRAWTFPPLRFVYFNITKALAVFYGRNRPDYYLTEGLPLLLTTALPFTIVGAWQAFTTTQKNNIILPTLAATCAVMVAVLSLISHKEVRFIYPLLPALHALAAKPLLTFFQPLTARKKALLGGLLVFNLVLAAYVSQVHQRGVIDVMHALRTRHEARMAAAAGGSEAVPVTTSVAFLMPCHSTPWRSHLVWPGLRAWALTCEPPIDVPLEQRAAYVDEADVFYAGPEAWLAAHMGDVPRLGGDGVDGDGKRAQERGAEAERRPWPQCLVFFAQLEDTMAAFLAGSPYALRWRGFNSHWHDDWRRQGDVVMWCMDGDGDGDGIDESGAAKTL
ncbi:glycosyltransferase family 22 protein [Aplosporella prunicola CBS 121167]|uniref:Mannosyltransferase n=1 Tax=Aplosporella prunicola CBS 121167 TaxID=1176127 RepID=A0A6A6BE93_9PEZI|nr:glycosyltransferase family 22 protein [Aplosporella prunicola CBS 121167]KAF2142490.1 glycosyltransferase family 22 protein [Aplosporella prunicola CBS 121167]